MVFLFIFIGLVFVGAAIPLLRRQVPPNHLYGLRVRATMENEAIWYEANARSARDLLWVGILILIVSALLYLVGWSHPDHYATACVVFVLLGTVWYCWRALRIAREVEAELGDQ